MDITKPACSLEEAVVKTKQVKQVPDKQSI